MVEKTQVQSAPPSNLPATMPMPLHPTSHHQSTLQHPPPRQRSPRPSRSHHHGSSPRRPDKRPVSTRRSPRRRRSSRRQRRSSRNRSYSRSQSRHRHNSPRRDRESSITFKSASPQRRDDRPPIEEYHQPHDYSATKPTLQASSWWKNQHPTEYNTTTQRKIPIILRRLPVPSGNRGASGRTTPRIPPPNINLHGKIPSNLPIATTLPTILPPNHLQHSPPPSQHRHATTKPRLIIQEMTNLNFQSPSLQVICSSISGMDPKQSRFGESDLDFATQIE